MKMMGSEHCEIKRWVGNDHCRKEVKMEKRTEVYTSNTTYISFKSISAIKLTYSSEIMSTCHYTHSTIQHIQTELINYFPIISSCLQFFLIVKLFIPIIQRTLNNHWRHLSASFYKFVFKYLEILCLSNAKQNHDLIIKCISNRNLLAQRTSQY